MPIFYPPPQPLFPRPQAVITQVTPAGAFVDSIADQVEGVVLSTWVPPYQEPQKLKATPVFPPPAAGMDLGFLKPPQGPNGPVGAWAPVSTITVFSGAAPPQGEVSSPPPPLPRNPAFESYLRTPIADNRTVLAPRLPVIPPFPDFGYIISVALRVVPSVDAAYRTIANTPLPPKRPQTFPTAGTSPSLVLRPSNAAQSGQTQAIQLVWLVPPVNALRLTPTPDFPVPPPPAPGSFAYDHFWVGIAVSF